MSVTQHLRCEVPANWASDPDQCLYEWQGLEGGGLAILAAVIGAIFLRKQIKQAGEHRKDQIARRHNAARAALPLALAKVSDITQQIADNVATEIERLYADRRTRDDGGIVTLPLTRTAFDAVSFNDEIVRAFQEFIQTLNSRPEIRHVAELLSSLQILLARYSSFDFRQAGVENSMQELLLDAGKVRFLNDRLYNYGRFVAEDSFALVGTIPDNEAWDQLLGKAQGLVFSRETPDLFLRHLQDKVQRYKDAGTSPWLEKFE